MKMEVNVCGVIFMITYFHELVAAGNSCMSKISQMSSFIPIAGTDYRVSEIKFSWITQKFVKILWSVVNKTLCKVYWGIVFKNWTWASQVYEAAI